MNLVTTGRLEGPVIPTTKDALNSYTVTVKFAGVNMGSACNRFSYDSITSSKKNVLTAVKSLVGMGAIDASGALTNRAIFHPLFGQVAVAEVQITYRDAEGTVFEVEPSVFMEMDGSLNWGDEEDEKEE